ncbi:MAG TPA: hypothetical protein VLG09_02660 [Candidatus Saccharimonadales bacterium]|nr:hypothetical protein [Candidatus Saccharimonadales bacterium]
MERLPFSDPTKAPDYFEPVIGYRYWRVDRVPGYYPQTVVKLVAFNGSQWYPGINEAKCLATHAPVRYTQNYYEGIMYSHVHTAPEEQCACGFYAKKDIYDGLAYTSGEAFGRVRMWGKVYEGPNGFRAQYAQIEALVVSFEVRENEAQELADMYQVPVYNVPILSVNAVPPLILKGV